MSRRQCSSLQINPILIPVASLGHFTFKCSEPQTRGFHSSDHIHGRHCQCFSDLALVKLKWSFLVHERRFTVACFPIHNVNAECLKFPLWKMKFLLGKTRPAILLGKAPVSTMTFFSRIKTSQKHPFSHLFGFTWRQAVWVLMPSLSRKLESQPVARDCLLPPSTLACRANHTCAHSRLTVPRVDLF